MPSPNRASAHEIIFDLDPFVNDAEDLANALVMAIEGGAASGFDEETRTKGLATLARIVLDKTTEIRELWETYFESPTP